MASFDNPGYEQGEVIVQEPNAFAKILTLNRPQKLNVFSIEMLTRLSELFLAYENDANVKLVILKGNGRAFCAGSDVVSIARHFYNGNRRFGATLSEKAFTMSYLSATYSKPQVSILNGIVMGAGAGVSIHGRFRVATENTVFAMPETALGSLPDVGSSYFLPRLPGFFGEYLGLTGARLDGPEMLALGLATHFVPSTKVVLLEEALVSKVGSSSSTCDVALISSIIDEYTQRPAVKNNSACQKMYVIDKCFSHNTVEEIFSALEEETKINTNGDEWLNSTIQSLKNASPISLKITLRSIREGRTQGVGESLVREYRMVCHIVQGKLSKDAAEGVRAILVDKDMNPKWEPSKLELITDQMVEHYFGKLDDDGVWKELKLPARPNLLPENVSA
ncbi:hypothetical protein M0R45_036983 [Rubus argutus]|uniref:3-hydroxyisobutyryl-CoA hydrolase n=1 Tax=Rubus argutus TaxID=59490 RepID=A0AAW1W1S3_RUBAR